jgi:DedD protein
MTVRDAERFKDKIEVSLDSRQIFFLFFGGAVVACLVFVLGVMVGKRLEARDRLAGQPETSAAIDPLAALDELAVEEDDGDLAFPLALAGDARGRPLGAADTAPAVVPVAPKDPPRAEKPARPAEKPPEPATKPAEPAAKVAAAAPPPAEKPAPKEAAAPSSPRFTLQLSSFQEKAEADAFVARMKAAGYAPYVIQGEVEGRGIFFRVRLGRYATYDDAIEAKKEFERKQQIIAYVTRL